MGRVNFVGSSERRRVASSRVANPEMADWGRNSTDDDKWKTDNMPSTGHDTPLDADEQSYEGRTSARHPVAALKLAQIADNFSKSGGNKILARRLRTIAGQVSNILVTAGYEDSFSTTDMELPGETEGDALDSSQEPGKLNFFGTHPVQPGQAGPEPAPTKAPGDKKILTSAKEEKDEPAKEEKTACETASRQANRKASKKAPTRVATPISPWESFKRQIRTASRFQKETGAGSYRLASEDFGSAVQMAFSAVQSDGAPLSSGQLTFSLHAEDRKNRTATVDISDPVSEKRVYRVNLKEDSMPRFARKMADRLGEEASAILG